MSSEFIPTLAALLTNTEISRISRQSILNFFEDITSGDIFFDILPMLDLNLLLNAIITFSLEYVSQEDPSSQICLRFIANIATIINDEELDPEGNFIGLFLEILGKLNEMKSHEALLVAIIVITGFSEGCPDAAYDQFDECEVFIDAAIQSGEQILIEGACNYMFDICSLFKTKSESSSLANHFLLKYEPQLLHYLMDLIVIKTVTKIYESTESTPSPSPENSLSAFCEQLFNFAESPSKVHIEFVCQGISSIISTNDSIPPEIYEQIKEPLLQLLSVGGSVTGNVLTCFSGIALTIPSVVIHDVGSILNACQQSLDPHDLELSGDASVAISNLINTYPVTIAPEMQNTFNTLFQAYNFLPNTPDAINDYIDDLVEEDNNEELEGNDLDALDALDAFTDEDKYKEKRYNFETTKGLLYEVMATLFGRYSNQLEDPKTTEIVGLELQFLRSFHHDDTDSVLDVSFNIIDRSSIFKVLPDIIQGLIRINQDPTELIQCFFKCAGFIDSDLPSLYWNIFRNIALLLPYQALLERKQLFEDVFKATFNHTYSCFYEKTKKNNRTLNRDTIPNLFHSVSTYFQLLKAEAAPIANDLFAAILPYVSGSNKNARGNAIHCLATILLSCPTPEISEQAQNLFQAATNEINSKDPDVKYNIFLALTSLIQFNAELFAQAAPELLGQLFALFENSEPLLYIESAVELAETIVISYNVNLELPQLGILLSKMPLTPDNPNRKISMRFMRYVSEKFPDKAAEINPILLKVALDLVSHYRLMKVASQEDKMFACQVIQAAPENIVNEILQQNESIILDVKEHMALFQSGGL